MREGNDEVSGRTTWMRERKRQRARGEGERGASDEEKERQWAGGDKGATRGRQGREWTEDHLTGEASRGGMERLTGAATLGAATVSLHLAASACRASTWESKSLRGEEIPVATPGVPSGLSGMNTNLPPIDRSRTYRPFCLLMPPRNPGFFQRNSPAAAATASATYPNTGASAVTRDSQGFFAWTAAALILIENCGWAWQRPSDDSRGFQAEA